MFSIAWSARNELIMGPLELWLLSSIYESNIFDWFIIPLYSAKSNAVDFSFTVVLYIYNLLIRWWMRHANTRNTIVAKRGPQRRATKYILMHSDSGLI